MVKSMLQLKTISYDDIGKLVSQAEKLSKSLNTEKNEIYKSMVKKVLKSKKTKQHQILILPLLVLFFCIFVVSITGFGNMYINIASLVAVFLSSSVIGAILSHIKKINLDFALVDFDVYDKESDKPYKEINFVTSENTNSDKAILELINEAKKIGADAIMNLEHKITSHTSGNKIGVSSETINNYRAMAIKYT
jgi:hypothetical protein